MNDQEKFTAVLHRLAALTETPGATADNLLDEVESLRPFIPPDKYESILTECKRLKESESVLTPTAPTTTAPTPPRRTPEENKKRRDAQACERTEAKKAVAAGNATIAQVELMAQVKAKNKRKKQNRKRTPGSKPIPKPAAAPDLEAVKEALRLKIKQGKSKRQKGYAKAEKDMANNGLTPATLKKVAPYFECLEKLGITSSEEKGKIMKQLTGTPKDAEIMAQFARI